MTQIWLWRVTLKLMGFFIVAILQTEEAFKELDLQLKYKAQYQRSISAGLIFESMLKVSVNRRLAAALEEGNGKTPSWLQWEEEQTLNGIKERRKQLHTEMASVQRWVHISRKYTCGLTKIHEGSRKQSLSWGIQNSKREISDRAERMVWGQDTGLGLPNSKHGLLRTGMHMGRLAWGHPTPHTSKPTNPDGEPGICCQGGCNHQRMGRLPRMRKMNQWHEGEAVKMHFFEYLKSQTRYWRRDACQNLKGQGRKKGTLQQISVKHLRKQGRYPWMGGLM